MKKNIINVLVALAAIFALNACKKAMDEHVALTNVDNTVNLYEQLSAQANLSKFTAYVKSTGYDQLLSSSQNYTVWAPTNDALAGLDAGITGDAAKLKDYVANHIALTTFVASKGTTDTIKVNLINKKYAMVIGAKFEEANIVSAGKFVKNGAIYTIDQAVPTKLNVWEYMLGSTDATLQTTFISNISTMVIDSANATIIGYNNSGSPIFAPNPPMVLRNAYWSSVADLRTESKQYTFFMLQNTAFTSETNKLTPYFAAADRFALVKDFTVAGAYALDKLPDTLVSVRGTKIPISKSAIVKSYKASNGIVYVMSAIPFRLKDKVPTFKIEGELPFGFRSDKSGNTFYRLKLDDKGIPYRDIEVYNHAVSEYYIDYIRSGVPLVKYKVYARAIAGAQGDSQTASFTQRYFIYNTTSLAYTLFATQTVAPLTYSEVYLGDYTPQQYGLLNLRLTSAASTAQNVNTLILDYLRFEPILP